MFPALPFGPVRRFPVHALSVAARIHCIASRWPEAGGDVTRGCIDDETPLLCENKRPSTYRGAWPVLHCCSDDWCNRDVIPTLPPWASLVEGDSLSLSLSLSLVVANVIPYANLSFIVLRQRQKVQFFGDGVYTTVDIDSRRPILRFAFKHG